MIIGVNSNEEKGWSTAPLSADLSLIGEYGGRNYGLPSDQFVVGGYGERKHFPTGVYPLKNWSDSPQTVRIPGGETVLLPGQEVTLYVGPGDVTATSELVSWYMPGVTPPTSRTDFVPNPLYADALAPFGAYRFTPQLVNNNSLSTIPDAPSLLNPGYAARVVNWMREKCGVKVFWHCLPHNYDLTTWETWLGRYRANLTHSDITIYMEDSNEFFNSAFKQGGDILAKFGDRVAVDNNEWRTRYRAAGWHQARRALAVKELNDPRFRTVFAVQADNPWVATEGLDAVNKADGLFINDFDLMAVGSYVHPNGTIDDGAPLIDHWNYGIDRMDNRLEAHAHIANDHGMMLGTYETNSHLVSWTRTKEVQAFHREPEMQNRFNALLHCHQEWLSPDAPCCLYRIASALHAMDFGLRDDLLPDTTSPRWEAAKEWAGATIDYPLDPEPEPADVRDLNNDGAFDHGDVQQAMNIAGRVGMVYLNSPADRPAIDAIAAKHNPVDTQ